MSDFTSSGYRVIALAHKPLESKLTWPKVQRIKREQVKIADNSFFEFQLLITCFSHMCVVYQVEKDMHLLGLLVMQNALKPETMPVMHQLQAARIRSVMVTGILCHHLPLSLISFQQKFALIIESTSSPR